MAMLETVNIKDFRRNADENGICEGLAREWDSCSNKKQLRDLPRDRQQACCPLRF